MRTAVPAATALKENNPQPLQNRSRWRAVFLISRFYRIDKILLICAKTLDFLWGVEYNRGTIYTKECLKKWKKRKEIADLRV